MRKLLASLFLIITLGMAQGANAGPKEDAFAANNRGDFATALSLLRPLATQGDAWAQTSLGFMYHNGQGVPRDDKEAIRWYRLAAAQGYALAQYNLGVMFNNGQGVPQDDKEAVRWYRLAAAQGNAEAQYNLRLRYEQEQAVLQDNGRAHMWYSFNANDKSQKTD